MARCGNCGPISIFYPFLSQKWISRADFIYSCWYFNCSLCVTNLIGNKSCTSFNTNTFENIEEIRSYRYYRFEWYGGKVIYDGKVN